MQHYISTLSGPKISSESLQREGPREESAVRKSCLSDDTRKLEAEYSDLRFQKYEKVTSMKDLLASFHKGRQAFEGIL